MKMGVAVGLVGPVTILFGALGLSPFPTAPRIIQLTMQCLPGSIPVGGTSVYVDLSAPQTGSAISIGFTNPPAGPIDVHILMYL
jgi:hypothetical protein